jgi:NADH-quinone oxidoreductase subunit G
MNVIDICPVGALTSKEFRFQARAWDMSETPSVCNGCARGCNTDIWVRKNEILRLTPRENQEVNNFWMCDKGRLESWKHVNAETRVEQPLLRKDGSLQPVGWDEALAAVSSELKTYKGEQVAVLGSAFDTCEDNFVAARFARDVLKTPWLDMLPHVVDGDGDSFLICDDKTPNAAGARMAGVLPADAEHGHDAMMAALQQGRIKALVVTDYRAAEHPGLIDAVDKATFTLAIVSNTSALTEKADIVLPAATFAEKVGTVLNIDGQLQLLRPAIVTAENERWMGPYAMSRLDKFASEFDRWGRMKKFDAKSTGRILTNLAALMGASWKYDHPEDVFEEMAGRIEALKGLSYEGIGRWGVRLSGETPAHMLPYVYSDVRS